MRLARAIAIWHVRPRQAPFPRAQRNETYAFDEPIDPGDLRALREQARSLLDILGITATGAVAQPTGVWRVSDTAHEAFGDVCCGRGEAVAGATFCDFRPDEPGVTDASYTAGVRYDGLPRLDARAGAGVTTWAGLCPLGSGVLDLSCDISAASAPPRTARARRPPRTGHQVIVTDSPFLAEATESREKCASVCARDFWGIGVSLIRIGLF